MAQRGGKREGAGRKKGFAALEAEKARELIATKLQVHFSPIVDKAIEQALDGDKYAREWLTQRGYGNVLQEIDLGNRDGESFEINDTQYKQLIRAAANRIDKPIDSDKGVS